MFIYTIVILGNNVFYCYGGVMLGPHVNNLILSVFLIVTTWIANILIVIPFLNDISLYPISLCLLGFNIYFLFATACTEPGIIPKKHQSCPVDLERNSCTICNINRSTRT